MCIFLHSAAECPKADKDYESLLLEAKAFCSCRSKSVEIFYESPSEKKILTKVYFHSDPDVSVKWKELGYIALHIHMQRPS